MSAQAIPPPSLSALHTPGTAWAITVLTQLVTWDAADVARLAVMVAIDLQRRLILARVRS